MDVRMPDGTLVRNVPQGITQEDLQERLAASRRPAPAPEKPEETSAGSRLVTGFMDPFIGAGQIMEKTGVPGLIRKGLSKVAPSVWSDTDMDQAVRERNQGYVAPEGIDVARIAGNIVNPVSWAGGGAGVGRAALQGAAQSALAPVEPGEDFWTQKAKDVALGGVVGGVAAKALPRVLGGMVKPTDEALALQRAGVTLTPGQAAGGMLNAAEQKAMSIPVVGDIIAGGRRRALGDFQERALEKATGTARGAGPKTVDAANTAVSDLYQGVVPKLRATSEATVDVLGAVAKAADNPELTKANREILEGIHDKLFGHEGERYMRLSGEGLKKLDSELGVLERRYGKSLLPSDHVLGDEIGNVKDAMRKAWGYHLDPADAAKLTEANKAYARMVPVNKAASASGGAEEKVFPMALRKAMAKQQGKDVTRAVDDALVDPATKVLTGTVPDSGTAGRLALPTSLAALWAAPLSSIAGVAGAAGAYSRKGSNFLTGNSDTQRWLKKQSPEVRKAFIAALRAKQAEAENQD
jgi:hypothetical protein